MAANIDLQDPAVQKLLGGGGARSEVVMPGSSKKATMQQIAGDEDHGISNTMYLNRGKHEVGVLFRPKNSVTMIAAVLTVDVYAIPGEPVKLHLVCPKCQHLCTVSADRKAIDWEPVSSSPIASAIREVLPEDSRYVADNLGILSVEEFRCTWELADQAQDTNKDAGVIVQGSLCRFGGVIDRNVLREV